MGRRAGREEAVEGVEWEEEQGGERLWREWNGKKSREGRGCGGSGMGRRAGRGEAVEGVEWEEEKGKKKNGRE